MTNRHALCDDRCTTDCGACKGAGWPRFSEVTPGDPTVPPGNRLWSTGQRRIGRLAGYGAGWLAVVALERLVAATDAAREARPC